MIGYADHLMANVAHPSEAPKVHTSVLFLMLDDGLYSTVMADKRRTCKLTQRQ